MFSPLRCPDDGSPLLAEGSTAVCPACGRRCEPVDGIYPLLPSGETPRDVAAERAQRDREARQYDHLLALRLLSLVEIPLTLDPLRLTPADRVVDVGCGTGRLSLPLLAAGVECVCVDHSLESLRVLRGKLPAGARVTLVQGDASRLPVCDGWATAVVSSQMLEHLPTPELRSTAVSEMARVLQPGGRLALTAYWHAPLLRPVLQREGRHSGEIFFHRFERKELRRLLAPHFRVDRLTGRLVYVLLVHGTRET